MSFATDGKTFASYEVNPVEMTRDLGRVFRDVVTQHRLAHARKLASVDVATVNASTSFEACDQDYRTPESIEEPSSEGDGVNISSWEAFREEILPDVVKTVTFTIDGTEISEALRDELREQFPGVELACVPELSENIAPESLEDDAQPGCGTSISVGTQTVESPSTLRQESLASGSLEESAQPDFGTGNSIGTQTVDIASTPKQGCTAGSVEPRTPDTGLDRLSDISKESTVETQAKSDHQQLLREVAALDIPTGSSLQDELARIGLELTTKGNLQRLLRQWQDRGKLKPWAARSAGKVQQFYSNMVRLYILDHYEGMAPLVPHVISLQSAVLLQFQVTAYQHGGDLPTLETALYALKYLPYDVPLCRWIIIQFAFLWGTQDDPVGFK
jgi:hypothetical protein